MASVYAPKSIYIITRKVFVSIKVNTTPTDSKLRAVNLN